MWNWLIHSNAGLALRISIGASIFIFLAVVDIRRHGIARATRWKEYSFLIGCVVFAMLYGCINDLITSTISWEYFYYGKELSTVLGPKTPPDSLPLHLRAMVVGIQATWTAGLLIGAVLLIANNPSQSRPQVSYLKLFRMLILIAIVTIACAVVLGIAGWNGALNLVSDEFAEIFETNQLRPQHFVCVFGVHLGGYLGGLIGVVASVMRITRHRVQLSNALTLTPAV